MKNKEEYEERHKELLPLMKYSLNERTVIINPLIADPAIMGYR